MKAWQKNRFKLGSTIYNHALFKIVYMLLELKMGFIRKKYIRDVLYRNRIYEIAFSKFKNKRCIYTIFEKGLPYISNAAFSVQIPQNRYIRFLKRAHRIYRYRFNKAWQRKFYT
ncbi:MAG TPA: hypothetical protein DD632_04390 [Oribacterium sp.]|nr:hypothetical protein [Oribacterium sp.]